MAGVCFVRGLKESRGEAKALPQEIGTYRAGLPPPPLRAKNPKIIPWSRAIRFLPLCDVLID